MAKAPKPKATPRLKVYSTAIGFHDALVAAPNQKAALKAWGTTTDLFAAGRATVVDDPDLAAEPLSRPGEVIKRLRGSEAAMLGPEPTETFTPALKRTDKPVRSREQPTKPTTPPAPPPPPPDRSRLDAAERDLGSEEQRLAADLAGLEAERAALNAREQDLRADGERRLGELRRAMDEAAREYERAARQAGQRPDPVSPPPGRSRPRAGHTAPATPPGARRSRSRRR